MARGQGQFGFDVVGSGEKVEVVGELLDRGVKPIAGLVGPVLDLPADVIDEFAPHLGERGEFAKEAGTVR